MPLKKIPGREAWATIKANRYSGWGDRFVPNRVEPVAEPAFPVPFNFGEDASIFTIGSCFARVVEGQLDKRGFRVPMVDLCNRPEFAGLDPAFLNNFGTPSIYYELASAFDEFAFDESALFLEIENGLYADMQLTHSVPLADLETVRTRRDSIRNAVRSLADCDALIVTLGLAEVWWDEAAGIYLNVAPRRELIDRNPERYSLCLLDFDETYDFLEKALDVAFRHGRDDLQVLLTVSPVPLITTFLASDVITASCYSKSLLRAVAEHVAARHERVTYLPLYEAVTLSDRQLAWQADLRHVSDAMVKFNVSRVLDAFGGKTRLIEQDGTRWAGPTKDLTHFVIQAERDPAPVGMPNRYLRETTGAGQSKPAKDPAKRAKTEKGRLAHARAWAKVGRYDMAIAIVEPICRFGRSRGSEPWKCWVELMIACGTLADLLDIESAWISQRPEPSPLRLGIIASAMAEMDHMEGALQRFERMTSGEKLPIRPAREYADLLILEGRPEDALAVLERLEGELGRAPEWAADMRERIDAARCERAAE